MLQLEKLTLENFGIIKNKIVTFDKGFNIIKAPTGSGKSTIIQAILMLLADDYEGAYDDYINNQSSYFQLHFDFTLNNAPFTISLRDEEGKTTRELKDRNTGRSLANGDEAKKMMASLLDPDIMKFALVSKQKEKDNIVTCKDSERRDLFKKIKNIDYDKYIKSELDPLLEISKAQVVELDKEIYRLSSLIYEYKDIKPLPFLKENFEFLEKQVSTLQSLKSSIELQKKLQIDKIKEKETLLKNIEENDKYIFNYTYDVNNHKQIIEDLKKDNETKQKEKINTEIITIQNNFDAFVKNKNFAKALLKKEYDEQKITKEKSIAILNTFIASIEIKKLSKYDDTLLEEAKKKLQSIQFNIDICSQHLESFKTGICPVCEQSCTTKADEERIKLLDFQNQLQLASQELKTLQQEKTLHELKIEEMQKKREEKNKKQLEIDLLQNDLTTSFNSYNANIKSLDEHITNETSSTTLRKKEKELLLIAIDDQIKKDIKNLEESLVKVQETLQIFISKDITLKYSLKEVEAALISFPSLIDFDEEELLLIKKKIEAYSQVTHDNEIILKDNITLKKKETIDKESLKLVQLEKKKNTQEQFNINQAKIILTKDFPNFVIDNSVSTIESNMNTFIDTVYTSLNVNLKATKTAIKLEYSKDKKGSRLPAHRLSGGEAKLVTLSFVHNFNSLLNLKSIILDEPDSGFDFSLQKGFYQILLNMDKLYNQIIIITHSDKMLNFITTNSKASIITI